MDRRIVYPGAIPEDTDILAPQQNTMIALGWLMQAVMGTNTSVVGLAVTQTGTPGTSVLVGAGALMSQQQLEAAVFGSLPADTTDNLMKMGINPSGGAILTPTVPTLSSGQSVNILVQAAFQEVDTSPVVIPNYNATNPASPFSGPNNSGTPQNTRRAQSVSLTTVAGTAATTGSQTTPAATGASVPLAVITLAFGWSTITNTNITVHPNLPALFAPLSTLASIPTHHQSSSPGTSTFTVPPGIFRVCMKATGGGGPGAGCDGTHPGGGGGAGGTGWKDVAVTPGQVITLTVGAGGTGGASGATLSPGGDTTITVNSLTVIGGGGSPGVFGATPSGGVGGTVTGGGFLSAPGGNGTDGTASNISGGNGGVSFFGGGGRGAVGGGSQANGQAPGSGGGGAYATTGNGGNGAPGQWIIEY